MRVLSTVLIVLITCTLTWAQGGPTTAPTETGARRGGMMPRGGRAGPMSPDQRRATLEWANQYMPDLAQYAVQYGRGRGAVPILALIRARMLAMQDAPADGLIRERMQRNIGTENQIGQYLVQMQSVSPAERAELQNKIQAAMKQNIEGLFAERQDRINQLKARLETEQVSLDQERQNIDQLVIRRLAPFRLALPEELATPPAAGGALTTPPTDAGR